MDLPKYENSKVTHEQTVELHKLLVQTVIDFFKKENIDEVLLPYESFIIEK